MPMAMIFLSLGLCQASLEVTRTLRGPRLWIHKAIVPSLSHMSSSSAPVSPSTSYGILSLLNHKGDKWLWGPDWGGGISVAF